MYDLSTKTVKTKTWAHLPACTSAFRWMEHYYCFHGNNFTRFHPVSGEVNGTYPKDARHYFMKCPNFGEFILISLSPLFMLELNKFFGFCMWPAGHGAGYQPPECSEVQLDAITFVDTGKKYVFAGNRVLIYIKHQSFLHYIQAFHSWLLQDFPSYHWPPQDPSTCALTLDAMVSMPSPSFVCGRKWLEGWMQYFPTMTKCT